MSVLLDRLQTLYSQAQGASGDAIGQVFYNTQQLLLSHTFTSSWEGWEAGKLRDYIYHALGVNTGGQCTPDNMHGNPKVPLQSMTLSTPGGNLTVTKADADSEMCFQLKYGPNGWQTQNPFGSSEQTQTVGVSQPYRAMAYVNGVLVYTDTGQQVGSTTTSNVTLDVSPITNAPPINPSTPAASNVGFSTINSAASQATNVFSSTLTNLQNMFSSQSPTTQSWLKYAAIAAVLYFVVVKE
jgi:hypothetical protein